MIHFFDVGVLSNSGSLLIGAFSLLSVWKSRLGIIASAPNPIVAQTVYLFINRRPDLRLVFKGFFAIIYMKFSFVYKRVITQFHPSYPSCTSVVVKM